MVSRLLIEEPPLQVLPSLAGAIGLNEAIVLQQVHYWLNPKHNKNVFNGRHWVWNTYEQWQEQFSFWGKNTIVRAINSLEDKKLLISYFDQSSFRKQKFYTIDYDRLAEISNSQSYAPEDKATLKPAEKLEIHRSTQNGLIDLPNPLEPSTQNGSIDLPNMGRCIYKDTENTSSENTLPPLSSPLNKLPNEEEELPQSMIDIWNDIVQAKHPSLSTKVRLTENRAKKLKQLFNGLLNHDLGDWTNYCKTIANSRFLMGNNNTGFVANLDWALNPEKALKILEGAIYDKPAEEKQKDLTCSEFDQLLQRHCEASSAPDQWLRVCNELKAIYGQQCFRNWLQGIKLVDFSGEVVILEVKTRFLRDYISSSYGMDLGRILKEVFPQSSSFELQLSPEEKLGA